MPELDAALLEANGLEMNMIGHYGIEHNEFDIYKIEPKAPGWEKHIGHGK